jgi:uncharacterized protein (TIGR03435 family)
MMQSLLADRLKLVIRKEQREMPQYALVLAGSDGRYGPNLQRVADDCDTPAARAAAKKRPPLVPRSGGIVSGGSCGPITNVARDVADYIEAPVLDKTGLVGKWDYAIYFRSDGVRTPIDRLGVLRPEAADRTRSDSDLPSLFDALQEQLGLKLERFRGPVDVVVIDSVERPTPD